MSVNMRLPSKKFREGRYNHLTSLSDLVEGEEYFCLAENGRGSALQFGTIYLCEKCKKPASVNTGWIYGEGVTEDMLSEAKVIGVVTEPGHNDDLGDVCEVCSSSKAAA